MRYVRVSKEADPGELDQSIWDIIGDAGELVSDPCLEIIEFRILFGNGLVFTDKEDQ